MESFGVLGMVFGMFGFALSLIAYSRLDKLEKKLKELAVLPENFKSDE